MKRNNLSTTELTLTAALIALSLVLTLFEIPFNPQFGLKIDFALVPIIIITLIVNRYAGIAALFIQFILVFYRNSSGWLFNAVAGLTFLIPFILAFYFIHKIQNKNNNITLNLALVFATLSATILATLANYFVLIPYLFPKFVLSFEKTFILYAPFNFTKFGLISIVTLIIAPPIMKYFKKA